MNQERNKRSWPSIAILAVLGLAVGIGIGLLIGWVVAPVEYVDTDLSDLHPDHKEEYTVLVASAYVVDGDLERARERLEELGVPNARAWMSTLVEEYIANGEDEDEIQALAELADALGVENPQMAAYLASPTPVPTDTPVPTPTLEPTDTPTPQPPTDTPLPPTETATPQPPTDTPLPQPTDTPVLPTDTPVPPTDTPLPPTNTPKPQPTNTPKPPPPPTNTPKPQAQWTIVEERLVGPGEDGQGCTYGDLQIRVTVVDANGNQIPGMWVYDRYSQIQHETGHKSGDPNWGIGEALFGPYGGGGGGSICVRNGPDGECVSPWTRDMPCWDQPPIEDMYAAGYCECCEVGASFERCKQLAAEGKCLGPGHYSWRVVFKRSW